MSPIRVFLTGVSSFTGYWFARTLIQRGCRVVGTCRRARLADYDGEQLSRLTDLQDKCDLVFGVTFGDTGFVELLGRQDDLDVFCVHGATVEGYRDPEFDYLSATAQNCRSLGGVLDRICEVGAKGVLLTGSAFEADPVLARAPEPAFNGYGLSKALTREIFRFETERRGIPLSRFVIPNPFGPLESPRFTAYLTNTWRDGKVAEVRTPDYVRDNIHVDLLSMVYADCVEAIAEGSGATLYAPSGYVETQGRFAARFAEEMRARSGLLCGLSLSEQTIFNEPMERTNLSPAAPRSDWDERSAWDAVAAYYGFLRP